MYWFMKALRNYATFRGRARRKEYWYFTLFSTLFGIPVVLVDGALLVRVIDQDPDGFWMPTLSIVYILAMLVPTVAVTVRRFHDHDRSGWWYLWNFVPMGGSVIVLVFMVLEGTQGPNRYGPDAKAAERPLHAPAF